MHAVVYPLQCVLLLVNQDNPVSKQYQSAQKNGCADNGWLVFKMSADVQKLTNKWTSKQNESYSTLAINLHCQELCTHCIYQQARPADKPFILCGDLWLWHFLGLFTNLELCITCSLNICIKRKTCPLVQQQRGRLTWEIMNWFFILPALYYLWNFFIF